MPRLHFAHDNRGRHRIPQHSEGTMKTRSTKVVRCAIYTRVSTDQGLEQDFNSLDAQREASRDGAKPTPWKYWDLGISTSTTNRIFQQVGGAITRVPPDATRLTRKQGPTQFFGKQPHTK